MRNKSLISTAVVLLGITLPGCNDRPVPADNPQLSASHLALDQHQWELAIENADNYLRAHPTGPGTAEALYLKGRGFEQKLEVRGDSDSAELKRDQLEARTAYLDALAQHPSPHTEGYIHASLSNVAFFQDDYPTALAEASRAYKLVESPDIEAILLFRMGESEQRMGRFGDADRTFQLVQSRYASNSIARSAHEHVGLRNFYLQLATYNSPAGADRAIASLQSSRVAISKHTDGNGRTVIDAGPFPTYENAKNVKTRFEQEYPDALIVP